MVGDSPKRAGIVTVATDDLVPMPGDIITAVGSPKALDRFCKDVGHVSTVALTLDRASLDYKNIVVSDASLAGVTIEHLRLDRKYGAVVTRIYRGNVEFLYTPDFVLQFGDKVRVVASRPHLKDVAKFFGDSEQRLSHFSLVGLTIGLTLGIGVGLLTIPLPGGLNISLGLAGGCLIAGLIAGRLQRTGKIVWTIPYSSSAVLSQLGIIMFLAYAGSHSGAALKAALADPLGAKLLITGIVVTTVYAGVIVLGGKYVSDFTGPRLAGVLAAAQTQPAVLAYANDKTDSDPGVNLGYAIVYPVAMIAKVVLGPLIGRF
jgi:putative transport protein